MKNTSTQNYTKISSSDDSLSQSNQHKTADFQSDSMSPKNMAAAGDKEMGVPHKRGYNPVANNEIVEERPGSTGIQTIANSNDTGKEIKTKAFNIGPSQARTASNDDPSNPMTYFVFKKWRLRRNQLTIIVTCLLILSLFVERFCFIVSVYKAKYYGYTLILIVIFLNCIFNFALAKLRKKKHKKRLHEIFDLERTPHVGWCIIGIIGTFDMLYAFFLFWPANVIPIWLLCALL